jgi:hypothetical protein
MQYNLAIILTIVLKEQSIHLKSTLSGPKSLAHPSLKRVKS